MSFDGAFSRPGGASEAGGKALTDESIELHPQLRDLRTALGIAFGYGGQSGSVLQSASSTHSLTRWAEAADSRALESRSPRFHGGSGPFRV